jgi:HAD superfamily hydrolase (TIGR01484 family)
MTLAMVVTDLDGTLLTSERRLSSADRETLHALGERGILRVVATGRSLFSALKVLGPDFPIDFLVHASGAGIMSWPDRRSLLSHHMQKEHARELAAELIRRELDFMLHHALPDNHCFYAHRARADNADFERRMELYAPFAQPLHEPLYIESTMSQALVIEPAEGESQHHALRAALPGYQVIRTTSPLDGASHWTEIFPLGVSKAAASAWLRRELALTSGTTLAIGNDYNDEELLAWADLACVVANAPPELSARYRAVASNDSGGFSEAVRSTLAQSPEVA